MNSKNKNIDDSFDKFLISSNLKDILSAFNQLCDVVDLNPSENSSLFYKTLQNKLKSYWKAQELFIKLDKIFLQKEYLKQAACSNVKSLIIGSGPCGLRCAIALALLGARVIVIEKRESFSRNNVLHLWPFVINDLKTLGAKIFFGMFCAGSIDHISIKRLQCILLKVALLFGVQIYVGVTFNSLIVPVVYNNMNVNAKGDDEDVSGTNSNLGWRAKITPDDHIISNYTFNTIVGADGKTNILGFPRKELRCRLAIAITVNFINKNTAEEAQVEEISGVAFIFNQQYFKDIYNKTGIDLENIVYYKDETHYFVMTAKKQSLLLKGVIKQDSDDPEFLLNSNNINYEALQDYSKEAANVVTNYKIPDLEFSKNHRGEPDVAVFDFTHMFAAENASKITEINGYMLLQMLVGDSLYEPFWPTGSGCALGFLSSLDAAWLVRRMGMINNALEHNKISNYQHRILILEAIAERESVYQRLSQTTSSNMPSNFNSYTLNPRTRYTQCKMNCIEIPQILHLYDTDDKSKKILSIQKDCLNLSKSESKSRPNPFASLISPKLIGLNAFKDTSFIKSNINSGNMKGEYMLRWFQIRLDRYFDYKLFKVNDLDKSWISGVAFLCLIHLYRPNLIDLSMISTEDKEKNLETAFLLFEKEFHITKTLCPSNDIENLNSIAIFPYLEKVYETLRVLNPNRSEENYEHKSLDVRKIKRRFIPKLSGDHLSYHINTPIRSARKSTETRFSGCNDIEKGIIEMRKEEIFRLYSVNFKEPSINKKTNNNEKILTNNSNNRFKDLRNKVNDKNNSKFLDKFKICQICHFCKTRIFQKNYDKFENYVFHKSCFRCQYCKIELDNQQFKLLKNNHDNEGKFYCLLHFEKLSNIGFIRENIVSNTLRDLGIKENKKLKKLFTKENKKYKCRQENDPIIRKPRYSLSDYGCAVSENQLSFLPVSQNTDNISKSYENDIGIFMAKNFLDLRRINNESDEEYDGSLDESTNTLLSLDVVEPCDEDQFSWCLNFNKQDLDYALKKCQVIRKNRLIYKKYKSKDESTSDESAVNMLVQDICKTSDEERLDDIITFNNIKNIDLLKTPDITQKDVISNKSIGDDNIVIINNENNVLLENETINQIDNQKRILNFINKRVESETLETNKSCNSIKDNSRNLRQMAKLKFCTEPPKPVSINPKEFISQINHKKMTVEIIPFYLEIAEMLPSINDVFVKITNPFSSLRTQITLHENLIISASILSINNYGIGFKNITQSDDGMNLFENYNDLLHSDHFEDHSPNMIDRQKLNYSQNIFNDIFDIKDIDSLSVNTEESSLTHAEIISENEMLKNIAPSKFRHNQKATMDSELDLSLGMSSIGEIPFENRYCSNNSLNSLETSSLNSSVRSDLSASSESDGKLYHRKGNISNVICHKNDDKVKYFSNSLKRNFRKSKTYKLKQIKSIKKRVANDKSSKNFPLISEVKYAPDLQSSIFFGNTVTPPQDIELYDNPIKCLEVNSNFSFISSSPMPLINLDNISRKSQRVNHIHKQLENIEDRLNELESKNVDSDDISKEIFLNSKNEEMLQEDSQTYICEQNEEIDDRIVMSLVL